MKIITKNFGEIEFEESKVIEFEEGIPGFRELKKYIISGRILPGERLPSVRDFSIEVKVNPNTMQKALQELESIGLIYTERTNGKFVTTDKHLIDKYKKEYASDLSNKYCWNSIRFRIPKETVCVSHNPTPSS